MSFLQSCLLLGVIGTNEIIILFVGALVLIPILIYKYGKNKGRLEEMERRIKDKEENR